MTLKVTMTIQPSVGGQVRYLALAPVVQNEGERFQLSFEATFINSGSKSVHLTKLQISFPDAPNLEGKTIDLETLHADETVTPGLDLGPKGDAAGLDRRAPKDFKENHNIILTRTPPPRIRFEVFDASGDSIHETFNLARYQSFLAGGAYSWFAKAHELARGEYWSGIAAQHCCGHQLYAHDLGVEFWDKSEGGWTNLLPGKKGEANNHYRVWGKPVYAMADGVVVDFLNLSHDNFIVGKFPERFLHAFGNYFILRHGSDEMVYAHFQQHSQNAALMQRDSTGAAVPLPVKAGDFLGLVGNSGRSSHPHLHIHSIDLVNRKLRPIPWQQKMVSARDARTPSNSSVWLSSQRQGLGVITTHVYPGNVPPADDREWSNWENLGGQLLFGPTVCSRGPNKLDVFGVGLDSALWHRLWNGNKWSEWENLGGQLKSKPTAVSWGLNRIDVFGRCATDNSLCHKWFDGDDWHDWERLGGTLTSGAAVCSRGIRKLDVFVNATDSSLHHKWFDGSGWHDWEGLGGKLSADPAAVSWSPNRIDVFGRGLDGMLWQKLWRNSTWSEWQPRNWPTLYGPAVSSRRANRLDVFLVAPDGSLQHNTWNGSEWTHWESLGGFLTGDPAAVSWNQNRIDVFGRGGDNALWHTFWRPS